MDLGTQNANKLISKDDKVSMSAASAVIEGEDVETFKMLSLKEEFLFDFIKSKILRRLISVVNNENVMKLFSFMKIYSFEFKNFIIEPLVKFSSPEITQKMLDILKTNSDIEKTYAFEYFQRVHLDEAVDFARENINSEYEPLKASSISLLAIYGEKAEYNSAINELNSGGDEYKKLVAADFLFKYGDKEAFMPIYEYFETSSKNELIAQNLLNMNSFSSLIEDDKKTIAFNLFASILRAFPYMVSFGEVFIEEDLLNYLLEDETNYAAVIIFYLKHKIDLILYDDNYLIELDNNDKKLAMEYKERLDVAFSMYDTQDVIKSAILAKNTERTLVLELISEKFFEKDAMPNDVCDLIKNAAENEENSENMLLELNALKVLGALENETVSYLYNKCDNEIIKAQIKSIC